MFLTVTTDSALTFLESIASGIASIVEVIISLLVELVYVITMLGRFVSEIPAYFMWLPTSAITLLSTIFAIVVVYKVVGRD